MVRVTRLVSSSENFKLLNNRKGRRNSVGKTAVIFPQIFRKPLRALMRLLGIIKA